MSTPCRFGSPAANRPISVPCVGQRQPVGLTAPDDGVGVVGSGGGIIGAAAGAPVDDVGVRGTPATPVPDDAADDDAGGDGAGRAVPDVGATGRAGVRAAATCGRSFSRCPG